MVLSILYVGILRITQNTIKVNVGGYGLIWSWYLCPHTTPVNGYV
jgi:hypothetical protein